MRTTRTHRFGVGLRVSMLASATACLALAAASAADTSWVTLYQQGDANGDGAVDIADPVATFFALFVGQPALGCLDAADANDDGLVSLQDGLRTLQRLFLVEGDLSWRMGCLPDPTPDLFDCQWPGACEFESLVQNYNLLETLAGTGLVRTDGVNNWDPSFESGPAIAAELSRPHMAQGDVAGNIYIADKDGHAIRRVDPQGIITTVAGSGEPGDDGDEPGPATQRRLIQPNGLYVRPSDGTVYILDLGNGKVRRRSPDGMLATLFSDPAGFGLGRGLWVSADESLAYYTVSTEVRRWRPSEGITVAASGFVALGNLDVTPAGEVLISDRGGNRISKLSADGTLAPVAGNGLTFGGGDGLPALESALAGVRGVWQHPLGGILAATHEGSQIWYIDRRGILHLFLDGARRAHGGDGEHFRSPGPKIDEPRAVTVDPAGHVIVTESDYGFIRRVRRR